MKNKKMLLLLQIIFVAFLFSCSSSKKVVQEDKTPSESRKFSFWKQSYYPKLAVGDSIFFYNSAEIVVEGNFFKKEFYLDGAINVVDNQTNVTKTVLAETSGRLFSLKKDNNGRITDMFVLFSVSDKTYQFNFKVIPDGNFKLNGNAKLFFEGKEYPVIATIKEEACFLLCIINVDTNIENINEKAEGVGY